MTDEVKFTTPDEIKFATPIEVKSKRIEINLETFQPLLIVTMDIALTLERMQDHYSQNGAHFPSSAYERIGRDILDAIQNAKDIPTDSPIEAFRYDPS